MKILLRKYGSKYYVWKDAEYSHGDFYVEDYRIFPKDILAVKDDNRKDSVMCGNCGEIIKNNPEAIEAHFAAKEAERDCFKCGSLRKSYYKSMEAEVTKNEDGTLTVKETYNAKLTCNNTWYNQPSIDTDAAKRICTFYRCRNTGVMPIKDIFTQYDNPFDKSITVDVLQAKNLVAESYNREFFEYDLKCRNTVKACVNELGIVDHFVIKHRNSRFEVFYSAKYDKLFFCLNGRDYTEDVPDSISQTKYDQAKAKISALFKEEKTNE
jgi:Zn ribbon nucleic-acid-binding protein